MQPFTRSRSPRLRQWARPRQALTAAVLLAPSAALLLTFTYWPVAQVLWRSLIVTDFGAQAHTGWGNYLRLLVDPHFARAAWNNALYAVFTIIPSVVLALLFALALQRTTRLNTVLRTLLVLPMLIPLVAAASLFSFVLLPGGGLLDTYFAWAGLGAANWLGDPTLALPCVIAITIWKNTGYYMLFFLAGLAGVSHSLLEAAQLDGTGPITRVRYIILPQLGPTFGFVVPIALLNALTQVDQVVTLTQGGPSDATNLLLYYIYQQAEQNQDNGLASAATVVSVVALLTLSLLSLRTLERGIHYES